MSSEHNLANSRKIQEAQNKVRKETTPCLEEVKDFNHHMFIKQKPKPGNEATIRN